MQAADQRVTAQSTWIDTLNVS